MMSTKKLSVEDKVKERYKALEEWKKKRDLKKDDFKKKTRKNKKSLVPSKVLTGNKVNYIKRNAEDLAVKENLKSITELESSATLTKENFSIESVKASKILPDVNKENNLFTEGSRINKLAEKENFIQATEPSVLSRSTKVAELPSRSSVQDLSFRKSYSGCDINSCSPHFKNKEDIQIKGSPAYRSKDGEINHLIVNNNNNKNNSNELKGKSAPFLSEGNNMDITITKISTQKFNQFSHSEVTPPIIINPREPRSPQSPLCRSSLLKTPNSPGKIRPHQDTPTLPRRSLSFLTRDEVYTSKANPSCARAQKVTEEHSPSKSPPASISFGPLRHSVGVQTDDLSELCSGTCSPKKCLYCLIIARSLPGSHDPMAWLLRLYKSAQLEAAAQKFRVEVLKQEFEESVSKLREELDNKMVSHQNEIRDWSQVMEKTHDMQDRLIENLQLSLERQKTLEAENKALRERLQFSEDERFE